MLRNKFKDKEANQDASLFQSTKLNKRATFPKPFPHDSIALQRMHEMKPCKARTMKHCEKSDQVKIQVDTTMVPVKEEKLKEEKCLVHWGRSAC